MCSERKESVANDKSILGATVGVNPPGHHDNKVDATARPVVVVHDECNILDWFKEFS